MELLTSRQAAEYVRCHIKTLQRLDRDGVLVPVGRTPTGYRRYSREQLDAYLGVRKENEHK